MSPTAERAKNLSQSVTVDASGVSVRDTLRFSPPANPATDFLQGSVWPLVVIVAGGLLSVLWTGVLLWLIGRALW